MVCFPGGGVLKVSAGRAPVGDTTMALWLQVRNVELEHDRLAAAGVRILRPPQQEPWGPGRDVDRRS